MPGTLQVGGNTVITHTGDAGAGTNTLSSSVSFNNRLVQIGKRATGTNITNSAINSSTFTWGNSAIELDFTPTKAGNLLVLHANNSGYLDFNDGRLYSTFLISPDNGTTIINVASDANGMNMKDSSNNAFDHLAHFYHYDGTDFGVGGGETKGYYTVQNTNAIKIRHSHRSNVDFRYYPPHVIFCYEYEVVS